MCVYICTYKYVYTSTHININIYMYVYIYTHSRFVILQMLKNSSKHSRWVLVLFDT